MPPYRKRWAPRHASEDGGRPAVEVDARARDEARALGGEECDRVAGLPGLAPAAARGVRGGVRPAPLDRNAAGRCELRRLRGLDCADADGVDEDPVGAELLRQTL